MRALLGGVKRTLEVYRRVDETTRAYPWYQPTTEEVWHAHAEGVLMVALTNLNLPPEAWKSARLLRAVPNCQLVLTLAYHLLSPALSIEEAGLMAFFANTTRCMPICIPSHIRFSKLEACRKKIGSDMRAIAHRKSAPSVICQDILSKHLAADKKSFAFQQKSSTMPIMNPSPSDIVFVEVTLMQYASVAGHVPWSGSSLS